METLLKGPVALSIRSAAHVVFYMLPLSEWRYRGCPRFPPFLVGFFFPFFLLFQK